jgi:15-hydroxyprostaglandin dehydrogenase (NAD)
VRTISLRLLFLTNEISLSNTILEQIMTENGTSSSIKTAIVTGGCSGIGLALVQHLLAKQDQKWRVVLADIRQEAYEAISSSLDPERSLFVHTDVANWDDNAKLFKKAYEWETKGASNKRIDFFAANAGIADREIVGQQFDLDAEPQKPNTACLEICTTSVIFGLKLFIHYTRKTQRDIKDRSDFNPKVVITASCVGQYPFPIAPQYAAAKHACVGYTRSVGESLLKYDNIAVNCIMPAFVNTNIVPDVLVNMWPKEYLTPLSTMLRAYDELMDVEGRVGQDGKSEGEDGKVKTAQSVECVIDKLFYRTHVPPADESQDFLVREAHEDGVWTKGLIAARAELEHGQTA